MSQTRRAIPARRPADEKPERRSDRETVVTLRLPRDLHERLRKEGGERGFAGEMRRRLEASFAAGPAASDDPWFGDLLAAISHAAAGAAKMRPLPKNMLERYDPTGRRRDITPYVAFAEAVTTLMMAFEPDGYRETTDATLTRLRDQLVGLALGALGDRGLTAFGNLSDLDKTSMKLSGGFAQKLAMKAEQARSDENPESE